MSEVNDDTIGDGFTLDIWEKSELGSTDDVSRLGLAALKVPDESDSVDELEP